MYSEDKKRVASWTKLIALRKGKKKLVYVFSFIGKYRLGNLSIYNKIHGDKEKYLLFFYPLS